MRVAGTLLLWGLAPTFAAWQEGKRGVTRSAPLEPFNRWAWKELRWLLALLTGGCLIAALAFQFDIPTLFDIRILAVVGIAWAAAGAFKLAARAVIPRRWVETEMDFVAITSLGTVIRIALWAAFFTAMALANWTWAFGFGVAAVGLALNGFVAFLIARWVMARRELHGHRS